MSAAMHTPEPWHTVTVGRMAAIRPDCGGSDIADCWAIDRTLDVSQANATRIVACINACEGVSNEGLAELPGSSVAMLLELAHKGVRTVREMRAQRDELLAALKAALTKMEADEVKIDGEWGACRSLEELEREGDLADEVIAARAAIAKAEAAQ